MQNLSLCYWNGSLVCVYALCYRISDLLNTFIIAMYSVMNYLLLIPNLDVFYAQLNEIQKIECHCALEVSFSI